MVKKYSIGISSFEIGKARSIKGKGLAANVSFFFADGPRETYNVTASNPTDALRESIPRIQQPLRPIRVQIRRNKP